MLHEHLTINNGRVTVASSSLQKSASTEVTLNTDFDAFYAANRFKNFGDLGANIKDQVTALNEKHSTTSNFESIEQMKAFVEAYPEFQKFGNNVTKHVGLVSELSNRIKLGGLLEISEIEQSLACSDSHTSHFKVKIRYFNPVSSNNTRIEGSA